MARVALLVLDDDCWADKSGYTSESLPPGWDEEKWLRRPRRGDVVAVLTGSQIPSPGQPYNPRFKVIAFDVADVDALIAKYNEADLESRPTALDASATRLASLSKYRINTALLASQIVETDEATIVAVLESIGG